MILKPQQTIPLLSETNSINITSVIHDQVTPIWPS